MERVRRRKLCRDLKRIKRYVKLASGIMKSKREDIDDKVENYVRCSRDEGLCHPYDDDIHWVHALSDLLTVAEFWVWRLNEHCLSLGYDDQFRIILGYKILGKRNNTAINAFYRCIQETYYADKHKEFVQVVCHYKPRLAKLESYQNRKLPDCGNYVTFADVLVQKAQQSVACSIKSQERRRHLKKLMFFQAMDRLKAIRREGGVNASGINF